MAKTSMAGLPLLQITLVFLMIYSSHSLPNIIKSLPGYTGDLPFSLETGYIGVGESEESQLFYYFIESERDAAQDPLVLWLTGGPGCSGLSGLLYEIGPITFNYTATNSKLDPPQLQLNPYSWTKVASILFLDSPVGTGFSHGTTFEAYHIDDNLQSILIHEFLSKWLLEHSKFTRNSLYIAGDSYSGKTVPFVVQEILTGNKNKLRSKINLKGYILGNPITEDKDVYGGSMGIRKDVGAYAQFQYAHQVSLLSDELYKSAKRNCNKDFVNVNPNNTKCINTLLAIVKDLGNIFHPNVLEPMCYIVASLKPIEKVTAQKQHHIDFFNVQARVLQQRCRHQNYLVASTWANDVRVRESLHVEEGTVGHWLRCDGNISYTRNIESSFGYHQNFTKESLNALIYNGDQDMVIPYVGTQKWIKKLNISTSGSWRPWFVNGQVAGYVTEYTNSPFRLTFTTIKGAGHTAPEYKARECLAMIDRWFSMRLL